MLLNYRHTFIIHNEIDQIQFDISATLNLIR